MLYFPHRESGWIYMRCLTSKTIPSVHAGIGGVLLSLKGVPPDLGPVVLQSLAGALGGDVSPLASDEFFNQAHWPIEPPHLLIDCLHEIDVKVEDWSVAHGDLACLRLLTKLRRADLTLTDAFVLDDAQDGPVAAEPGLHQLEALMLRQCSRLSVSSILQQPQAALPQLTHLARSLWRGGEPG